MPKLATQMKDAWNAYRWAYQLYHKTCYSTAIEVKPLQVRYISGNLWELNGVKQKLDPHEEIDRYFKMALETYQAMLNQCAELPASPGDLVPGETDNLEAVR